MSPAVKPDHHETSLDDARRFARVDEEGHVYALAPATGQPVTAAPAVPEAGAAVPEADGAAPEADGAAPEADGAAPEAGQTEASAESPAAETYVGQFSGASADEALHYFTRKFDELYNRALLLRARAAAGADSAKALHESLGHIRKELTAGTWVGDVAALSELLKEISTEIDQRAAVEAQEAEVVLAEHLAVREQIVAEVELLADADPTTQHWKSAQARMNELFEAWKAEQKKPPRLTKSQEDPYWKRFRAARNLFEKNRRAFFATRDKEHGEVKAAKEALIAEAEQLKDSDDYGATTKAYHRLMDDWKALGRGARKTDDAQWARFRAAQDVFFGNRDKVNAETDAEYAENLTVKLALLEEFETLMPIENPEAIREKHQALLNRWDAAGRVPRADMKSVEGRLKRVQDAFRDAEQTHWRKTDPETLARQNSMLTQLDEAIAELEAALEAAQVSGDDQRISEAKEALDARRSWRDMLK
ncbi:DUF349 domain-containing protein [Nesterenkonia sp. E16_7]|uniref:DUF349 domain-containing protein n=1 Tax=unclassified Nesterenkonia TaxID=2629769 RepID=UPI001A929DC1|nr:MULTISPECIES: DUF349 domain-containing protein [unclassified Nesterenkonia]MBO0595733.1 DUF349 domain-containing protein [Nesterenkonia sp. E16_10]MBO0599670.1 DUF349 domain-containing protein [Nesterenkonia sp. E16_7]